jgi:hypothetical protein
MTRLNRSHLSISWTVPALPATYSRLMPAGWYAHMQTRDQQGRVIGCLGRELCDGAPDACRAQRRSLTAGVVRSSVGVMP